MRLLAVCLVGLGLLGCGSAPKVVSKPRTSVIRSVTSEPELSEVFTATSGTWTGSPTFTYQWQRCAEAGGSCANIVGSTTNTYTVVEADVSHRLRVAVTAKNSAGTATANSAETGIVPASLGNTVAPAMKAGIVAQGTQLELSSTGTWAEEPAGFALSYQWERCKVFEPNALVEPECVNITAATNSTYTPVAADAGYSVRAKVIAKAPGKRGSALTGYTVGVEPKYENLYAADSFWRQKLPKSGEQLMTEQARYAKGFEAEWTGAQVSNEPNTAPFYFVPPGLPTHTQALTIGKNFKEEVKSAFAAVPMPPWVTGAKVNAGSTPGNPDKHTALFQIGSGGAIEGEWDMLHTEPELTSEVSTETAVNGSVFHVTGAEAKGFVLGARVDFDFVQTSVTTPKPGVVYYVVGSPSGENFEVAATPGGTAIKVATAAITHTNLTKVGVLNDVRKSVQVGALSNASVYKPGYFEEEVVTGSFSPSPFNKEMWRWGSTTGSQPRGGGILTYQDFGKIAAAKTCLETEAGTGENKCHPIEHALVFAAPARKEHIFNGAVSEGAPCVPGSCWSGNMKTDGESASGGLSCSGEAEPCFRPREGMHFRLKETTDCKKLKGGGTAKPVERGICEALKEYGAVMDDKSSQMQLYAQEAETLVDATAFTGFNPYTAGPKFFEEVSGKTIAEELPIANNVEVMTATEYCGGSGVGILKEVAAPEAKTPAVKEGTEAGGVKCQRPTNIE